MTDGKNSYLSPSMGIFSLKSSSVVAASFYDGGGGLNSVQSEFETYDVDPAGSEFGDTDLMIF